MPKMTTTTVPEDAAPAPAPLAAHAAPGTRRTVEEWARLKGHGPGDADAWLYGGARAAERWPEGAELTEAEYDAAIARVRNVRLGTGSAR